MKSILLNAGRGRTKVSLSAQWIGNDLIVYLFNGQGHLGAVAVADFCHTENRASTSIITRLGHKDDAVAGSAARKLCRKFKKPICAIAGIHVNGITEEEIARIVRNCDALVERLSNLSAVTRQLSATAD
jgi:gallate decarboxylase subunit D